MKYREATQADWEAIAALHAESWRVNYRGAYSDEYLDGPVFEDRRAVWRERLAEAPEGQFVVVCEDGGEIVGFACAWGMADEKFGTLLDNLHVRPGLQGQGIGKRLVKRVAAWHVKNFPGAGFYLGVLEQNQRGQRFYERLGGVHEGSHSVDTPGGGTTEIRRYAWPADALAALAGGADEV